MVIENHPRLDDGSPFPTLFWLTCPLLVRRVSTSEATGVMNVHNERLALDARLKDRLQDALDRLLQRRDALETIERSGAPPGGGPDKVKCLHAHVAQELADPPNPIGAACLSEVSWPDCREPCVAPTGRTLQDGVSR